MLTVKLVLANKLFTSTELSTHLIQGVRRCIGIDQSGSTSVPLSSLSFGPFSPNSGVTDLTADVTKAFDQELHTRV